MRRRAIAAGVGGAALLVGLGAWLRLRDGQGDFVDQMANSLSLKASDVRAFEWQVHNKKHWQITSFDDLETAEQTDAREKTRGACTPGMVEIRGNFLLDSRGSEITGEVESLQTKTCSTWINRDFPARCADFDKVAWAEARTKLKTKPMHFCIDRFEYPNRRGAYPWVVASYVEAQAICKSEGKRLCNESEWTFACEGEEGTPYPGAYERSAAACVTDRGWREFDSTAFYSRASEKAEREVDRLWQGEPSGARESCRSSFGVYDMTGNVDESTQSVRKTGYRSVLKGGYWGPVRARCRPATRAHDEHFVAYQQGFRCCSAAPEPEQAEPAPAEAEAQPAEQAAPAEEPPSEIDAGTSHEPAELGLLDEDEELGRKMRGEGGSCGLRKP